MSFYKWSLLEQPIFIGFENYLYLPKDEIFIQSLLNTLYYTFFMVICITFTSLCVALLLFKTKKLREFFISFYTLPMLTSLVVLATIWSVVYMPFGPINTFLYNLGLPTIDFFSEGIVKLSIVLVYIWRDTGYFSLIILGGLLSISPDIFDAAKTDGASEIQTLIHVTLPILKPIIFLVIILLTVGGFSVFTIPFIMTAGGPGYSSEPLPLYVYDSGWRYFRMGYACSLTTILLVIIISLYSIQRKIIGGT
jgi:multiple sugar transport system permease protein